MPPRMSDTETFMALLRGINVGGHNRIAMADLRSRCEQLGWRDVSTYIQSGNVVFYADGDAANLELDLEQALEQGAGLRVPVLVRRAEEWQVYISGNPFPKTSEREPKRVMLALSKLPPRNEAVDELSGRARSTERVDRVGDALWIHFEDGAGRSKLTPAVLDRALGSPVTTRNWRTVLKLGEMAGGGAVG